jgi:hypothetical protein
MAKAIATATFKPKPKKNNKGIIAKTKTSNSKTSKNYKKPYKGQGR